MKRRTSEKCRLCENAYYAKRLCKFHYDRNKHGVNQDMPTIRKQNEYEICGDIAIFTYYNKKHEPIGKFMVDRSNVDKVKDLKWSAINTGYIVAYKDRKMILLHRFITNCPSGMVVDHINRNKLDNRISNLRICTQKENMENCDYKLGVSNVRGISKTKRGYYIAQKNGEYLGCSKDIEIAKTYL